MEVSHFQNIGFYSGPLVFMASQQSLRHRGTGMTTTTANSSGPFSEQNPSLTIRSMQKASPQHMGYVRKLQVTIFYLLLPRWIQACIWKFWCLSFLRPAWKPRYLILLGSYLYKFKKGGGDWMSQPPNGSPVPLDEIHVHLVDSSSTSSSDDDAIVALMKSSGLDASGASVFCISTLRKKYYYACAIREESLEWINTLREARQESMTRTMGHATKDSFPSSWTYYDNVGTSLARRKERIRTRLQESNLRELEMSNLMEGGPIPRGYYG